MRLLLASLLLLAVSTSAYADGYVRFPNSGLNCRISNGAHSTTTVLANGRLAHRSIRKARSEANAAISKTRQLISTAQARLKRARGSRARKLNQAIAAGRQILDFLRQSLVFIDYCQKGLLDQYALPYPIGGNAGGGVKR